MSNITRILIDNEELSSYSDIIDAGDKLYIPTKNLTKGDQITFIYDEQTSEYNEAVFLSVDNKESYKNLALEVEVEFVKKTVASSKNFEIIVRAVSKYDKTFTVDEYYTFGIQDSYMYFSKVMYHAEGENSYPYKVLFDLSSEDDVVKYFEQLDVEKRDALFLPDEDFKFGEKYKFRCDIVDNIVSFRVKNTSKVESMETDYPWITLFENVNIDQKKEDTSPRNDKLDVIVSSAEPLSIINGKGLYGFSVPNSEVKIYRFEVIPFDKNIEIDYFDDHRYSKEIASDFSSFYRSGTSLKLNSSDSVDELNNSFVEKENLVGNQIDMVKSLKVGDVEKIQVNNIEQINNVNYEDKFVDLKVSLKEEHNTSRIKGLVDSEIKGGYGQKEEYFDIDGYTDGVSFEYNIDESLADRLNLYPNAKVGDLLLEVNENIIQNNFDSVGLRENLQEFYTNDRLEEEYSGSLFFMETFVRGERKLLEMGPLGNGRFTFVVDDEFASPNDSYRAIWQYRLMDFVDIVYDAYSEIEVISISSSGELDEQFSSAKVRHLVEEPLYGTYVVETTGISGAIFTTLSIPTSGAEITLGYALSTIPSRDIEILSLKTEEQVKPDFVIGDLSLDGDVKRIMENGAHDESIRLILRFYQNLNFMEFGDLFLKATKYDNSFLSSSKNTTDIYGGDFTAYTDFRNQWLLDLDYNSHVTTNSIQDRKFYVSFGRSKYSIDTNKLILEFVETPKVNKKMIVRVFYDSVYELTDNYYTADEYYFVDESIKKLHVNSNAEKGISELLEYYNPSKISVIEYNDIPFVIVPKSLNENDGPLFADIEVCVPYVEANENIKQIIKAPLKKISVFLANDFESSQSNELFPYTTPDILLISANTWNREKDFYDFGTEFFTQQGGGYANATYAYDFPRAYPLPNNTTTSSYYNNGHPVVSQEFFSGLLDGNVVPNGIIDKYLNVSSWYNFNESKLGPYYKRVLNAIIEIKSQNRYHTEQQIITESQNPFLLGNWFDGFYSGTRTSWEFINDGDQSDDFGVYEGTPWGTENSRTQMINQIKNTISGKFPDYEIYYVDLSEFINYQRYTIKGVDSGYVDPDLYPVKTTKEFFLDNPFVDPNLKFFEFGQDIFDDSGAQLYQSDGYQLFTDNLFEYPLETKLAYNNLRKINFEIKAVVRPIVNGIDMYWDFDAGILFSSRMGNILPKGTEVNAEFEYSFKEHLSETNSPDRIIQRVNLGRADGEDFQKFPNPNVIYNGNIDKSYVHKVWLDNYEVEAFNVFSLENSSKLEMNLPKNYKSKKDVSVLYKSSNYSNLSVSNLFVDEFNNSKRRDFNWMFLTRDVRGYLKKETAYLGYITDSDKIINEDLFHLAPKDSSNIKTSGVANATDIIRPIQTGTDAEDIVAISSLRRNNNFELSVDVYFDEDLDREDMKTDIIFRGKFKNIDGKQFLNEFYSITLNLGGASIGMISRAYDKFGIRREQLLAKVEDDLAVIKRGVFYTLKLNVIKDNVVVYFNERNQEEIFYFSYNLKEGHELSNLEVVADKQLDGLNIKYETPDFHINGDRIGIRTVNGGVNISKFRLSMLEGGNTTLESGFNVKNYDNIISLLKKKYNIDSQYKKFKRTSNGYEFLQIGDNLFYRRNDGVFSHHRMIVEDFDIIEDKVYVRERVIEKSSFNIINVYRDSMKLIDNIVVDGTGIINEPILSYLTDTQRVVTSIEEIDGRIFIVTNGSCYFAENWNDFGSCTWIEIDAPWNLYG